MPVIRRTLFSLSTLLVVVAPSLAGQSSSPEEVAVEFLDAMARHRWNDASRLLDQRAFEEVLEQFLDRTRRSGSEPRLPTVDDLRRRDPSMPRDVAEWQIRQMRDAEQRYGDPTPYEFARVRSAADLRRLSPREAAARWLEARDPRYAIRLQLEAMRCSPDLADELPVPDRRVIGALRDGQSVAFALYREEVEFGGPEAGGDIGIIELRVDRGRWLIQPRGDLLPELSIDLEDGSGCPGR